MIHGIHLAFFALGGLTILSVLVFAGLRSDDGVNVSRKDGQGGTAAAAI